MSPLCDPMWHVSSRSGEAGVLRTYPYTLSLASVKSRSVLPLWYRLTRVVPDNGPLNGFVLSRAEIHGADVD